HHLVWSKSPEETLDLVNYYLQHPQLRQRIARQGQAEVYRKHTYQQRVPEIMPYLQSLAKPSVYVPPQVPPPSPAPVQVQVSHSVAVQPSPVTPAPPASSPAVPPPSSPPPPPLRGAVRYSRKPVRIKLY
ncbi:MAG: glycosyltransferase family 1 protein, partial [Syntrophomonadaceae bacterium]|nr:glycosyltransferase family 1 protein [Syntrophomonadaceae bacterium]